MDHNPATTAATLDAEGRRLLWRCRRGMKELDILLERFAREVLPTASPGQRTVFNRFLELPDPVLLDYLLGQGVPPEPELAELADLVGRIIGLNPARQHPMAVIPPVRHDPAPKRPP
jgi:antitoxin CptB